MSGARNIVAFVAENENGILRHLSLGLMGLLEPDGYQGHLIDLAEADWAARLRALAEQGITMAWGHAGIAAGMQVDGRSLWDELRVPFISVLADPPCWRPGNHTGTARYVANAYLFREWFDIQRRFIRAPLLSTVVQGGLVPNPARNLLPWRDRTRRMVLVKTGGDPALRRAGWKSLPRRWRAALEDAAAAALPAGTGDVTPFLLQAMAAHGMEGEAPTDRLFALMTELDLYVRDSRSTALVRALLDLPVDVFGRGWGHVRGEATRARFHPAFDAAVLPGLYAETQFVLNTTPNFASGVHERVPYALDARCCVISDQNAFMRERLADVPTLFAIDPHDAALPDRLRALHEDRTDYSEATAIGVAACRAEFDGVRYMRELVELAEEVAVLGRLEGYRV